MSLFRDESANGSLRPPDDTSTTYATPQRPERVRQLAQFVVAAVAFVLVGVVLAQIIGSGNDDRPESAIGSDAGATPMAQSTATPQATPTDTGASIPPEDPAVMPTGTVSVPDVTPDSSVPVAPTETAAPSLPTHQQVPAFDPAIPSLVVSPDYVSCDDTVTAYGVNFAPGTTITIYGGQLIGDNFAPVVDEHPVAEDGSFEVDLNLARLIGGCGGGDAEREDNSYRLYASTGNALVKDGIDPDGPTAMTVLTYSTDTPVGITDRVRLPSCGTEYIMNATMRDGLGPSPPNREARECFAAAAEAGALAEFTSHLVTDGFGIITTIYNSLGNGDVDVIVDGTRDPTMSGEWVRYTCVFDALSDDGTTFRWEDYCSEPVTIE